MINNNIIVGSSAFYLPTYQSKQDDAYFYQLFKQALENGYKADDALQLAREKVNSLQKKETKRIVENNEKTDNNTRRRK